MSQGPRETEASRQRALRYRDKAEWKALVEARAAEVEKERKRIAEEALARGSVLSRSLATKRAIDIVARKRISRNG